MTRVNEPFECPKLGEWVLISYDHIIHRSSRTGLIDKELFGGFSCKSANLCGVFREDGGYDWEKCLNPHSQFNK
jgi:hypothetical protein